MVTYTSLVLTTLFTAITVQAQLAGLSSGCSTSAASLLTSPFGACINILSLASLLSTNGSLIAPLNNWLGGPGGACTQTCSTGVLANASTTFNAGCAADLASGNPLAAGIELLLTNYTQVRNVACLQATSNNTFCISNLFSGIQNATSTTLTISALEGLLTGGASTLSSFASSISPSTFCTDCSHGLVTELLPLANTTERNQATTVIQGTCGAGFVDGKLPSGVSLAASSSANSTTTTSGAGRVGALGALVLVGLVTLV